MIASSPEAEPPGGPRDRLLPWPKVRDMTGLSRTTAWRRQKAGDFPLPVQISPGRVGWWESELTAWKASRLPRAKAAPRPGPRTRSSEPPSHVPNPSASATASAELFPVLRSSQSKRPRPSSCNGQIAFEF